jgi:hypothetical protein
MVSGRHAGERTTPQPVRSSMYVMCDARNCNASARSGASTQCERSVHDCASEVR